VRLKQKSPWKTLRLQKLRMPLGLHKSQLGQRERLISLPSRSRAPLPLWMLRAQSRSQVPLKLRSLQKTLRQSMLGMPMTLNRSSQELQPRWWLRLRTSALCTLTLHVSLPLPLNDDDHDGAVCDDDRGDDAWHVSLILLQSKL